MTTVSLLVVTIATIYAASTDVRHFKVPNALTFSVAGIGLCYHAFSREGSGIGFSVAGLGLGLILLIIPYAVGVLGAGDVKFLAAIGAWTGPQPLLPILLIGCFATGVFSVIRLYQNGGFKAIVANLWFIFRGIVYLLSFGRSGVVSGSNMYAILAENDRKVRLVPFSAMMAVGILFEVSSELYPSLFVK